MDMDKVKTITLAVIAVALLFIGYSLFQISQNGRYQSIAITKNLRAVLDTKSGAWYLFNGGGYLKRDLVNGITEFTPEVRPEALQPKSTQTSDDDLKLPSYLKDKPGC